tara:strand:+ start:5411 stop:6214 length:804 start_codon:yes stop_codon:yes gene_type:complete
MFKNVYLKNLRDLRTNLTYWLIGLLTLSFYLSFAYNSFSENLESFNDLIDSFPKELLNLLGAENGLDMSTFAGFLNLEIFGVFGPIMLIIIGINSGTGIIAGELNNKTIEIIMSSSISRNNYLIQNILVMLTKIFSVSLFIFISFMIFSYIFSLDLEGLKLLGTIIHLALLSLVFGSLSLLIGSITGNKNKTLSISAAIAILSHFMNAISPLIDATKNMKYFSVFHYYKNSNPIVNGMDFFDVFIMSLLCIIFITISFITFKYKDLH